MNSTQRRRKEKGLCTNCGGANPCMTCKERKFTRSKELMAERKIAGLCVRCGGNRPCQPCYEAAYKTRRKRELARKEQGLCTNCGKTRPCWCKTYRAHKVIPTRPRPEMCELCEKRPAKCLDHDHTTNKFRGWLCVRCNTLCLHPDILRSLLEWVVKGGK